MSRQWKGSPSAHADPPAAIAPNHSRRNPMSSRRKSSSIRGRISGPIPIPSPMDSDYHEQYHARSHSTAEFVYQTPVRTPLTPEPDDFYGPEGGDGAKSKSPSPQSQRQRGHLGEVTDTSHGDSSLPTTKEAGRTRSALEPGMSVFSPDNPSNAGSKDRTPQKKAGFRQTVGSIGRLLGLRKKKRTSSQAAVRTPESGHTAPSTMHTAESVKKQEGEETGPRPQTEHKRSVSLPHGVAHHSEEVEAPAETVRHSLRQDFSFSRKYTDTARPTWSYGRGVEPLGLSPRPAGVHGRGLRQKAPRRQHHGYAQSTNAEEIGRAITTKESHGLKRRSRSLSALGTSGDDVNGVPLSPGFSLHRASVDPETKSLASSAHARPDLPLPGFDMDEHGNVLVDVPESPLKPFNFDVEAGNKPAGLTITEFASFEPRIATLETKVEEMRKEFNATQMAKPEGPADAGAVASDSRRHTLVSPPGDGTNQENPNGRGCALSSWLSKSSSDAPDRDSAIYTANGCDGQTVPLEESTQQTVQASHQLLPSELHVSLLQQLARETWARQTLEDKVARLEAQFDRLMTAYGKDHVQAMPVVPAAPHPAVALSATQENGNEGWDPHGPRRRNTISGQRKVVRARSTRDVRSATAPVRPLPNGPILTREVPEGWAWI